MSRDRRRTRPIDWMQTLLLALVALTAASCDEPVTTPGDDDDDGGDVVDLSTADIQIVSGSDQTGVVGANLADPLVVQVVSSTGTPLADVPVSWEFDDNGGSAAAAAVVNTTTNTSGQASTTWELAGQAGSQTAEAWINHSTAPATRRTFTATAMPDAPATITLTPGEGTLEMEETLQLEASAVDQYGNSAVLDALVWASDDPGVATVTSDGLVTAVTPGETTVRADQGSVSGTAGITVNAPPQVAASLVLVDGDGQTGPVDETLPTPLSVRLLDTEGAPIPSREVEWTVTSGEGTTSSATSTTDADGVAVTSWTLGTTTGTHTARAEAEELDPVDFEAEAVAGPVAALVVAPESFTLDPGSARTLELSGTDAFGNDITEFDPAWSSSDPGVATVSTEGRVTAVAAGEATIQALENGIAATSTVTVNAAPQVPGSFVATDGDGQTGTVGTALGSALQVRLLDTGGDPMEGRVVDWAITTGAGTLGGATSTTDADGFASMTWTLGTTAGAQSVTASTDDIADVVFGATAEAGPLTTLTVTPPAATIGEGEQQQLTASGTDAFGNAVTLAGLTWSSDDTGVATVNTSGRVTGVAAGTATIEADQGGITATSDITVTAAPQVPGTFEASAGAGQTATVGEALANPLRVRLLDTDDDPIEGRTINWAVATGGGSLGGATSVTDVNGFAEMTWTLGTTAGTQSVTASTADIADVTFFGFANAGPIADIDLTPTSGTIDEGETLQLTASGTDAFGNAVSVSGVTWSSDDTGIATVNAAGLVTGVAEGSTTIEAELSGVTETAAITVEAVGTPQTIFFQEDFEDTGFAGRGWYDNTGLTITSDEVHSGSNSLEVRFNAGAQLPTFGPSARKVFTESESVYIRYWVKYSANWQGSGRNYHPHEFYFLTNEDGLWTGPARSHLTTYVESWADGGNIRPVLAMKDAANIDETNIGVDLTGVTENRAVAGCNGNPDGYTIDCYVQGANWANEKLWRNSSADITEDTWHLIEVYYELNSIVGGIGQADGVAQYWLDGTLVFDMHDIMFRTGQHPDMRFDKLLIAPYIGDGSPVTQTMWVDDLLIADKR